MSTVVIPEILLPADNKRMTEWAVNACDQYTSDYEYWRSVAELTRGCPSSLNLIFPEIYLKDEPEKRIEKINETMREYLSGGIFKSVGECLILVERTTQSGMRTGIVLSVDLEDYSFEKFARTPVRSTEATILERIPPRVQIRRNAPLELPHVMLLYDDVENSVLKIAERGETLYDFNLQMNGGRVKGVKIANSERVAKAFEDLAQKNGGFLFAVGDGNHSLATAKTCWENIKVGLSDEEIKTHPARFALAEAVNIYDGALLFEPIHRYVKCANAQTFLSGLKTSGGNTAYIVIGGEAQKIPFNDDIPRGIRELDDYVSRYICENGGETDYIHGENDLKSLTLRGGVGIILPPIKKEEFFNLISSGGNLPRKTFSMGEGNEKRYYIEAKRIR